MLLLFLSIVVQCGYESAHEVSFLDIQLDIKPFGSTTTLGSVVRGLSIQTPSTHTPCYMHNN